MNSIKKTVNIVIKNKKGQYLLQFRDNNPGINNPLKWNFWGGDAEGGESELEASKRELEEETGVKSEISDYKIIGKLVWQGYDVYLVSFEKALEWGEFDLLEGAGCGYFNKEDLLKIPASELFGSLVKGFVK